MYLEDLIELTNLETEKIEFKARLEVGKDRQGDDKALRWLKEIAAFANSNGGTMFVGVNDKTHEIEPLDHMEFDKEVQLLYDQVRSRIEPEIEIKIKDIPLPEGKPTRYVLKIDVMPSYRTPVFLHIDGGALVFVRKFGRSESASTEEIVNLALKNERSVYDEIPTKEKFKMDDFSSFSALYEKNNGQKLTEKALKSVFFADQDGYLTNGGKLFTDLCDSPLSLIKITQYQGINRGSSLIKGSYETKGNLFSVIEKASKYIKEHTNSGYLKTDTRNIDVSAYPLRSLTEGLVNAYAHRNYFISGSQISVDIFLDRMEITSPGTLLSGRLLKKEKDLGSIDPQRRNQVICNGFVLLRMMEAKGSGFAKISEDYNGQDDNHSPYISCNGESFKLVLPDLTYASGIIGEGNENPDIAWNEGQLVSYDKEILSHCYVSPKSLADIAAYIGLVPSSHLRNDIVEVLVENGLLKKSKRGYTFYYQTDRSKVLLEGSPNFKYVEKEEPSD